MVRRKVFVHLFEKSILLPSGTKKTIYKLTEVAAVIALLIEYPLGMPPTGCLDSAIIIVQEQLKKTSLNSKTIARNPTSCRFSIPKLKT